jgi:uncharacterized protein
MIADRAFSKIDRASPPVRQPRDIGPLRSAVVRHPMRTFVVLTLLVSTAAAIAELVTGPVTLLGIGSLYGPFVNIVGSAVPALVVTAIVSGRTGVRELARRSLRWRVPLRWYAIALLAPPMLVLATTVVLYGVTPLSALVENWPLLLTSFLPTLAWMIVLNNVAEEVGWTGFLFPRLQHRHGPMRAAMLVTVPFWLWHVPGFLVESGSWQLGAALLAFVLLPHLASRIIVGSLYNVTGASVLIGGLFHAMHNALVNPTGFGVAVLGLPQTEILIIVSGLFILAAAVVAVTTRGRLGLPSATQHQTQLDTSRHETVIPLGGQR